MPAGDRVGEAHVDIHVNAGPGEAELAAFKAKVDRDFAELGRKKAEAELQLKAVEFDKKMAEAKAQLDYFKSRRASATLDLAKKHFDEQIAAAEAELKALGKKRTTVRIDTKQLRAANRESRLLADAHRLEERAALQRAKVERRVTVERDRAAETVVKTRAEIAKLSDEYEKLRGRQIGLEKSSRRVFSSRSIGQAAKEARELEHVAARANYVKYKIEKLGGSVRDLDPEIERNNNLLGRWVARLGGTRVHLGLISTSVRGLVTGMALLGPILFELGGGLVSLVGTMGEGLVGAATVSAGALAGVATAAAGVGFIIGPMIGEFKEVHKATEALAKAELKYGKGSDQAKKKQEELNQELRGVSPIAKEGIKSWGTLQKQWKSLTKAARPAVFTAFGESLKTVQALLPGFARESTKTTQVAGRAWDSWMKSLRSSEAKKLLGSVMSDFRASIPGLASGIGSLVAMLGRLSAAGGHFLPGLSRGFAEWADNLEQAVGGGQKLQSGVGRLVTQMQDFGHLTQNTGSLLVHIFDASADSGDGLVKSLDNVIQRWDKWSQSARGKAGLKEFFSDSKVGTEDFMSSLSHLTKLLFEFSRATAPVANGLLKVVTWIGDIVSAADGLLGVKEIFQGLGIVLAGLWVASKVLTYADAIGTVVTRLGGLVGIEAAATAATEAEAVAATEATVALEAQAVAAAEADVAMGAGLAEGAASAGIAMEGTAASAGLLATVLAPEVLIPVGVVAGLAALTLALKGSSRTIEDVEADFRRAGQEINHSLDSSAASVDKYVAAQHRNIAVNKAAAEAREKLVKLQKENAPANKITRAVEDLSKAEKTQAQQARQTGVINKKQIADQKSLIKGAEKRISTAKEEIKNYRIRVREDEKAQEMLAGGGELPEDRKKLAKAEHDLAKAGRDVVRARRQEAASAVPYERSIKNLKPISEAAEKGLRKLVNTIGASATKKIGKFVDPKDVQRVTELGNKLTKLGRGAQVKNIAVNSKGADQTINKLRRLQRETNRVEAARATIKVGANDQQAQSKLKRLSALSQRVTGTKQTVHILANSSSAEQAVSRLQQHLRKVAHEKYVAEIHALDKTASPAEQAHHRLRQAVQEKYSARIEAIDNASSKAKDAESAGNRAKRQQYKLNITATNEQALAQIHAVESALAGLHNKTVSVNVVTHRSGKFMGGQSVYIPTFATGGQPTDRDLQKAADKAVIRPGGRSQKVSKPTMLTGEQAPRHPEYVIATNPAYRQDNERYLDQAAGDLGYEVIPAYKKGKGKKHHKGKKGGGKGGPGPAPPKGIHKAHWYIRHDHFAPKAVHKINKEERKLGRLEHEYTAEERQEQSEISHGTRDHWNLAWFRNKLEAERGTNDAINSLIHGRAEPAAEKAMRSAERVFKGPASAHNVKTARDDYLHAKAAYGNLKSPSKGKGESDAAYAKKKKQYEKHKRNLKRQETQTKRHYERLKKQREHSLKIFNEAREEFEELHGKAADNEAANQELNTEITEIAAYGEVGGSTAEDLYPDEAEQQGPTELDYAKARLVKAELEHNTAAEEAARGEMIAAAEREYQHALTTPTPEDDIEKGEELKRLREEGLTGGKASLAEQTSSYNEARAQLYQQFASNIAGSTTPMMRAVVGRSGGSPNYVPGGSASMMAAATPALQAGATSAAPGGSIQVVNNFSTPPPDPHTWAKQQEFELGALA